MAMAPLPPGYTDIRTVASSSSGVYSVMGLVVDALPPRKSAGTSFESTFTLKDTDFDGPTWKDSLKVKFFNDNESMLPRPQLGDVVLVRKISVRARDGVIIATSSQKGPSPWVVFSPNPQRPSDLSITCIAPSSPPSAAERPYALAIARRVPAPEMTTGRYNLTSAPVGGPQRNPSYGNYAPPPVFNPQSPAAVHSAPPTLTLTKFSLIKDLQERKFSDIIGEVVRTYYGDHSKAIIHVTDYTENNGLHDYTEDGYGGETSYRLRAPKSAWPGPMGRMTIQIALWEPHASYARAKVKEGDFVSLRNVHPKISPNRELEGLLHQDRMFPDRLQVAVIGEAESDDRLKDLVRRKQEYWKRMKKMGQNLGSKRQNSDEETNGNKKSKRERRREKAREETNQQQQEKTEPEQPKLSTTIALRDQLNTNIRASHFAKPFRSIQDILDKETHKNSAPGGIEYDLPFQNLCYRASVRVVDFFPPNLEDFAVEYNADTAMLSDGDDNIENSDSNDDAIPGRRLWEWRFCLLVEDGGPGMHYNRDQKRARMELYVAQHDAEFLLRMDAEDLRKNPEALARLREKLFILWGNLEEKKSEIGEDFDPDDPQSAVSAKPFACCIKEYGIKARHGSASDADGPAVEDGKQSAQCHSLGWERRFRMFNTTIP